MTAQTAPIYLDDIAVGDEFRSAERQLDADQVVEFARRFDPQFHLDEQSAKDSFFGGLASQRVAHGRDYDEAHRQQRAGG